MYAFKLVCLSVKDPIVHFERGNSNETAARELIYFLLTCDFEKDSVWAGPEGA